MGLVYYLYVWYDLSHSPEKLLFSHFLMFGDQISFEEKHSLKRVKNGVPSNDDPCKSLFLQFIFELEITRSLCCN